MFVTYTAGAAIPIGIAVGRQRLQETTSQTTNTTIPQLQTKDLNRFNLGLTDLGEFTEMNMYNHIMSHKNLHTIFFVILYINDVLELKTHSIIIIKISFHHSSRVHFDESK